MSEKINRSTSISQRRHRFDPQVRRQLAELARRRDNWHGLLALATNLVWIFFAFSLAYVSIFLMPVSVVILGIRQRALATLLHEAAHGTLARSRRLCALLGSIAGWSIFQTFASYRQSHCKEHHPFLGIPQKDPDLANYVRQRLFEQPSQSFVRAHLIEAARGGKIVSNIGNLIRDRLLIADIRSLPPAARFEYFGLALFWVTLVYFMVLTGAWFALILWLAAYLTVFQTLNWLIELCEHFPIIRTGKNDLEITRNREGHWVEDFITGMHGEKWHLVHHLQPSIPYWLLKDAHRVMMDDSAYAAANEGNSGVFTRGPSGRPSILAGMPDQLAAYQLESVLRK